MRLLFWTWIICFQLCTVGCAKYFSQPEIKGLDAIESASTQKGQSFFLPLLYRLTDASVDDVRLMLDDERAWEAVCEGEVGHALFPKEGYHWYSLRLNNPSEESVSFYLSVLSVWWTDYQAWKVSGDLENGPEIQSLDPIKLIGIRYPLVVAPKESVTVFLRTRVRGPSLTRIQYTSSSAKQSSIEEPSVVIGISLGLMVLMLIYNLGFFAMLRERTYLYFSGLILSVGGLILDEFGFWSFVGFTLQEKMEAVTWLTLCILFTGLTFNRIVYESYAGDKLNRVLRGALLSTFIMWSLWILTGASLFYVVTTAMHLVTGLLLITISWRGWREQKPFMGNLMVALLPMSFVSIYVPVMRAGFLPQLLEWPYLHLLVALFFQAILCSILPTRFQNEVVSRELLHQSLEEKEKRFLAINDEVRELVERFKTLENEDQLTRDALRKTQESRMTAQRKLRDAHQQLRHLEYHVSLGRLVAGVAHDIGNPATHISGCVQSFRTMIQKLKPATGFKSGTVTAENYALLETACSKLEAESSYIVRVNRALARYGRIDDSVAPGTNIQEVTEQVICVLASRLRSHEVHCDFEELPELTAKPGQISQLLANLILNAIDAVDSISDTGRIVVSGKVEFLEDEEGIELKILDNGPGIPDMVRRSGFRPFVTTRNPAKWLGIGLSIAKRIVEEHGGQISFPMTDMGAGGIVRVWLPVGQK